MSDERVLPPRMTLLGEAMRPIWLKVRAQLDMPVQQTSAVTGIVARAALAAALKSELHRFFTTEFDPQHWDMGRDDDPEEDYIQTRDRVLNHAWFASAK